MSHLCTHTALQPSRIMHCACAAKQIRSPSFTTHNAHAEEPIMRMQKNIFGQNSSCMSMPQSHCARSALNGLCMSCPSLAVPFMGGCALHGFCPAWAVHVLLFIGCAVHGLCTSCPAWAVHALFFMGCAVYGLCTSCLSWAVHAPLFRGCVATTDKYLGQDMLSNILAACMCVLYRPGFACCHLSNICHHLDT